MIDAIKQAAENLRISHSFATATIQTPAHNNKCKKFLEEYIVSLDDNNAQLGCELLTPVLSPYGGQLPKLIIEMGGSPSLDKRRIIGVGSCYVEGQ